MLGTNVNNILIFKPEQRNPNWDCCSRENCPQCEWCFVFCCGQCKRLRLQLPGVFTASCTHAELQVLLQVPDTWFARRQTLEAPGCEDPLGAVGLLYLPHWNVSLCSCWGRKKETLDPALGRNLVPLWAREYWYIVVPLWFYSGTPSGHQNQQILKAMEK